MTTATPDLFSVPDDTPKASVSEGDHVDVPRDGYGRYLLPDPKLPVAKRPKKDKGWTRATTFAKSISDTYTLSMWSQRMAIKGIAQRPDLYALAVATPLDDRDGLNKLAEEAKNAAGAKVSASLGTALHSFTESHDKGEDKVIPAPWDKDVKAYANALAKHGLTVVPAYIERIVLCEMFGIAGTFDRIFRQEDGTLVVGDLKTGKDLQYGWNEIAIQLALYANSDWIYDLKTRLYEPMPKVRKDIAVVLHLPVGKAQCTAYEVDIEEGIKGAAMCAGVREWRKQRHLATPMTISTPVSTTDAGWADMLELATSTGELSDVFLAATRAGEWNSRLQEVGLARQKKILELGG